MMRFFYARSADRQDADAAYAEYLKDPTAVYSLEDLEKEEGLS